MAPSLAHAFTQASPIPLVEAVISMTLFSNHIVVLLLNGVLDKFLVVTEQ